MFCYIDWLLLVRMQLQVKKSYKTVLKIIICKNLYMIEVTAKPHEDNLQTLRVSFSNFVFLLHFISCTLNQ